MADSSLNLPGNFSAGTNYLIKGETLLAWRNNLIADRALPGSGLQEVILADCGRFLEVIPLTVVGTVVAGSAAALEGVIADNTLTLTLTLPTQEVEVCVNGAKNTRTFVVL